MVSRIAAILLVGATLTLAACNTVRGAAADVNSAANCTQNAINGRNC
jgi:predicted small secreted protein